MSQPEMRDRDPHRRPVRVMILVLLAALTGLSGSAAFAIPSPELIVSSVGSLSQVGAILSALLGGGAAFAAVRGGGREGRNALRRRVWMAVLAVLFAVSLGLNWFQWNVASEERSARLSATLTRPTRLPGQPKADKTLKELSPAEQAAHPLAMTPAEFESILKGKAAGDFQILDIRETAEVEMGTFADARAIRFPDLMTSGVDFSRRKTLLICHNGNRSSETCLALARQGIDCRFMAGGLERWIVEGRRAGGFYRSSLADRRVLPDFPNRTRLLDTAEVRELLEQQDALLVDVRYPGEFAAGHLPGAVNIPMRRLRSAELERAISALPPRPVIVPCYERRSCFFGELLGLSLTRTGRDFRGRYTLPWEYTPTPKVPAHVAAALAEQQMGPYARAGRWLATHLRAQADIWGMLVVLIVLALLSRLVILPFALKADRDQLKAVEIEPEVASLKARLAHDPRRLARALGQLYKRHGLTPLRNLLALLGLPILALCSTAVAEASRLGNFELWPFGPLDAPDPTWLLPLACGGLLGFYLDWALTKSARQQQVMWLLAAPAMAGVMALMPAATALYVALSLVLIIVQRAVVVTGVGLVAGLRRRLDGLSGSRTQGIVPLRKAAREPGVGGKARRLGALMEAGFDVPRGVVLTPGLLEQWPSLSPARRARLVRKLARAVGRGPYAVRSSAEGEDGAAASHAGVFETVTDVGRASLAEAIDAVLASYADARATTYTLADNGMQGGIVVQRMVVADYAGVVFTRSPDAAGLALVELVEGAGELLVSGQRTPQSYRYGRFSGTLQSSEPPPLDLAPLLTASRRIEQLFATPQDIEWVYAEGNFAIVQSRDITTGLIGTPSPVATEWERVLALASVARDGDVVLERNELAEMLPRPSVTTLSLMEALHGPGGSVDLACRRLGLTYGVTEDPAPLFPPVFGRLYLDRREAARRAPTIGTIQIRRILRSADTIEQAFRKDVAPAIEHRRRRYLMLDLSRIDTPGLFDLLAEVRDVFVHDSHVEAEVFNVVADICLAEARRRLVAQGIEPAIHLRRTGTTILEQAVREAMALDATHRDYALWHAAGHRARLDYELAEPRYFEDVDALEAFAGTHLAAPAVTAVDTDRDLPEKLAALVQLAGRLQTLKEDAKHVVLGDIAVLRLVLLEVDLRLGLDGDIYLLSLDEVQALRHGGADAAVRARIAERRSRQAAFMAVPALPQSLSLAGVEKASAPFLAASSQTPGRLRGTRVAGVGEVQGPAYVVSEAEAEAGAPLHGFAPGDVLVAPMVHPSWLREVLSAGGVVSGAGGWLSHMAIVARERDVAMIVGVSGWHSVTHGQMVHLTGAGDVLLLDEAGSRATPPLSTP